MLTNIILWLIVGTVSGLGVFYLFPTKKEYLGGIITAGIAGAFFGGTIYSLIRIGSLSLAIDPVATIMALFGAVMILRLMRKVVKTEEDFLRD